MSGTWFSRLTKVSQEGRRGRLTPEAVHNQRFATTRLTPGYAMEEVDAFLEEVKEELARLTWERDQALEGF